jgi:hypothetical protein
MTLAEFTMDGYLKLWSDPAGNIIGEMDPWFGNLGPLESATGCPRLHVNVSVDGIDVGLAEAGSGTPLPYAPQVQRCALPTFQASPRGGSSRPVSIRIWDDTMEWRMLAEVVHPTASLLEPQLRIGTWAGIQLNPVPTDLQLSFDSKTSRASFSMHAAVGYKCATDWVVSADGGEAATDAGAPCPLTFTPDGASFLVPDVGAATGTLGLGGWVNSQVLQCQGPASCDFYPVVQFNSGWAAQVPDPIVTMPAQIVP